MCSLTPDRTGTTENEPQTAVLGISLDFPTRKCRASLKSSMGKSQSGMINMNDDSPDDGLAHTAKIKGVQPSYFKGLGDKIGGLVQSALLFIDHK